LTPEERINVGTLLKALYSSWNPPADVAMIYIDEVDKQGIDLETARKIIIDAKRQHNFNGEPPLAMISEMVKKATSAYFAEKQARERAEKQHKENTDVHRKTLGEWRHFYEQTVHGRAEWEVMDAKVRRGLRDIFAKFITPNQQEPA
jgi:hypothetical protein